MLLTKDNGPQAIQWIWARKQSPAAIQSNPALNAIEIDKGALGNGLPHRTLSVLRHHRLLLTSKIAQRIYGKPDVLAAAKDLIALDGIGPAPTGRTIIYYHILMPRHEILFAEGAAAESLYLGKEALKAIEPTARKELQLIFGTGWDSFAKTTPEPAHQLAQGKKLRELVIRHHKNSMPLTVRQRH